MNKASAAKKKKRRKMEFVFRSSQEPVRAPQRNNGRLEVVRLSISAGLPPGGRAAALTPLSSMYSKH